jgi:hypothetical protein
MDLDALEKECLEDDGLDLQVALKRLAKIAAARRFRELSTRCEPASKKKNVFVGQTEDLRVNIYRLPGEVKVEAMKYLSGRDLCQVLFTSRASGFIDTRCLWFRKCFDLKVVKCKIKDWTKTVWPKIFRSIHIKYAAQVTLPRHRSSVVSQNILVACKENLQILDLRNINSFLVFYDVLCVLCTHSFPELWMVYPPSSGNTHGFCAGFMASKSGPRLASNFRKFWPGHKEDDQGCRRCCEPFARGPFREDTLIGK